MSAAPVVIVDTADHVEPSAEVASFTWLEVAAPVKVGSDEPQLPAPWSSAQVTARWPWEGSTANDG